MDEVVVFVFEDGEILIRKDLMYFSAVFSRDFSREGKICLNKTSISDYKDFFQFLQRGEVPIDPKEQKNVYNLLVEWKFQFTHLDSFLWRISDSKIPIKFNQKAYVVNFSRFLIHSSVFRDLYLINPSGGLEFRFSTDEESFIEFLDVVHGVKYAHEIAKSYEVYKICEFFGCDSLCNLFDVKKVLLKDIISGFDLPIFEKYMSENLKDFLNQPEFASVPLPILIRLFQQNKNAFSFSDLRFFFDKYYYHHPTNFQVLFNNINLKFQTTEEIDEFSQVMPQYLPGIGVLTSNFFQKKATLLDEIKYLQTENTRRKVEDQQRIEEMNKKMESKEAENQRRIEELNQQMKMEKAVNKSRNKKLMMKYQQEMDWRKREEEEKRLREELDIKKKEEKERKQKVEFERIGKWKSTQAPDFEGNIFEASAKGKLTSIIYLLANGTNVNERFPNDDYDGLGMKNSTPLHFSSRYGHLSLVEYLVSQKADLNAKANGVLFFDIIGLLFIVLLKMVIFVLLNI